MAPADFGKQGLTPMKKDTRRCTPITMDHRSSVASDRFAAAIRRIKWSTEP
jgi:hypothetical protein